MSYANSQVPGHPLLPSSLIRVFFVDRYIFIFSTISGLSQAKKSFEHAQNMQIHRLSIEIFKSIQ